MRRQKETTKFPHGLINRYGDYEIPRGAFSNVLNWLTKGDKFELRRGTLFVGNTVNSGVGKITGIHTAFKADGTQVLFRTRGRKVEYLDTSLSPDDWAEVGTNILPAAADGEDVVFANYHSPAGAQVWFSSPNSGLYKIMVANPGSYKDNYDSAKNYLGYIGIQYNRMDLWNKSDVNRRRDRTGVYMSKIDNRTYTTVTAESLGTGDGVTLTFSGTLAAVTGKRTCFGFVFKVGGTAVAYDDYNGAITGTNVSTGSINYSTGAWSITFTAGNAPANLAALTGDYQWEDSTSGGIADFTFSGTRVAGEGNVFRQDDGAAGAIMSIKSYEDTKFCFHEFMTYRIVLTNTDTDADNNIFREKMGIPSHRAAEATADGIYFVDDTDETDPKIRLSTFDPTSAKVLPISISDNLMLTNYRFDLAVVSEHGELVLVDCRHKDFTYNQTTFVYNKKLSIPGRKEVWDQLDHFARCRTIYNGALIVGDSIQNNCYEVFSGLDDDDSEISNYAELDLDDLDYPGWLKKEKVLVIQGEIGPNQTIEVYMATDRGDYGNRIGVIEGSGDYVDRGQAVFVGSVTVGRSEVGGGGDQGDIPAYNYVREITLRQDKFELRKLKFVATGLGYASVSTIRSADIRLKGQKLVRRYRD